MTRAMTRPGGRTTDLRGRAAKAVEMPPGTAEIYQLGYSAGKRAGEHLAEEKAGGDYWVGYADGLLDGATAGTEGLKAMGAHLASGDDLTALGAVEIPQTPAESSPRPCPVRPTRPRQYGRRTIRPVPDGGSA